MFVHASAGGAVLTLLHHDAVVCTWWWWCFLSACSLEALVAACELAAETEGLPLERASNHINSKHQLQVR
jgi:hypothetical protein